MSHRDNSVTLIGKRDEEIAVAHYRKKPVVIEAWPVADLNHAAANEWDALPGPVRAAYELGGWVFGAEVADADPTDRQVINRRRGIYVPTLEGSLFADAADWIICGVKGEFYPCKPDIFDATYGAVGSLGLPT